MASIAPHKELWNHCIALLQIYVIALKGVHLIFNEVSSTHTEWMAAQASLLRICEGLACAHCCAVHCIITIPVSPISITASARCIGVTEDLGMCKTCLCPSLLHSALHYNYPLGHLSLCSIIIYNVKAHQSNSHC